MTAARELWFVAPRRVEVRSVAARPALEPGEVRARALASGISRGTELLLYLGEGPEPFDPSLDAPGAPTYPRRYGYAWVGEVTESRSAQHPVGARVFGLLPHGDEHTATASHFRSLPAELAPARAVLAANLETAVSACWDAGVALGDRVVVAGGGVVGLLAGYLARQCGARHLALLEPVEARRRVALELGFERALEPARAHELGSDYDVAIEASGEPASLNLLISRLRLEGCLALASFYGQRTAALALGSEFHRRRLTLRATQVSRIPATHQAGWTFQRRFELVCQILRDAALDALLEQSAPLETAPAVYERLARQPPDRPQSVFEYTRTPGRSQGW